MFVIPTNVFRIQQELKDYQRLCQQYNHSPAKEEFDDIVNFILLHSGGGVGMFESIQLNESTNNYLYENFIEKLELNEDEPYKGEDAVDTLVGNAVDIAKKAAIGIAVGGALASVYIAYRFKKKKLTASLGKEKEIEMQKLDLYKQMADLAIKIAKLKGEAPPKLTELTQPAMEEKPAMPEKPDRPGPKDEN